MFVKASNFFTKDQLSQIREAVRKAEGETSGEIRVHIDTWLRGNVLDRAAWVFKKIGMHATKERNGILFYLAVRNKKFAVIGDAGINEKVPEEFWQNIRDAIEADSGRRNIPKDLLQAYLLPDISCLHISRGNQTT